MLSYLSAARSHFFKLIPAPKILYSLPGKTHLDSLRFATDDLEAAKVLRQWLTDK
ncbi:MAG: hypothetical protein LH618_15480 [Saprospiraceae bacterium]|nr:hypothetical protein [Saprospiraceae bacterium]